MKKVLVIYNPVAGKKKFFDTKQIIDKVLRKFNYDYDFFETAPVKKQIFEEHLNKKYDYIVVSGGDGTVAEVSSILIRKKIKTPLIIIPQGSANLLALALRLPIHPKTALEHGLRSEGKFLDAMQINRKYYGMIACGIGYDTIIMKKTSRKLKRKIGFLAYAWTILKTIFFYNSRPYKISIDGKREVVSAKTVLAFNILPLGGSKIIQPIFKKQILADDGIINIFAFNPKPVRDLLGFKNIICNFQGKNISIKSKREQHYQIDGNVFKGKVLNIEIIPKAIKIAY